jgi:hypothetical protein
MSFILDNLVAAIERRQAQLSAEAEVVREESLTSAGNLG